MRAGESSPPQPTHFATIPDNPKANSTDAKVSSIWKRALEFILNLPTHISNLLSHMWTSKHETKEAEICQDVLHVETQEKTDPFSKFLSSHVDEFSKCLNKKGFHSIGKTDFDVLKIEQVAPAEKLLVEPQGEGLYRITTPAGDQNHSFKAVVELIILVS